MRAAKFARDAWPEQTPGEVIEGLVEHGERPRSWEELDCPDEIELELPYEAPRSDVVQQTMAKAGLSVDEVAFCPALGLPLYFTKQTEDCWYAGVPRGRRLVLRRI